MAKCPATQALQKKLLAAAGTCAACEPQVEYLATIGATCPEFAPTAEKLALFLEHLKTLTEVGMVGMKDQPAGGEE